MLTIPVHFYKVVYDYERYPGAPGVNGLEGGANCQLFAYELIRHFGRTIPDFRSRELWEDEAHTHQVTELEPLDLLLFNKTEDAYGAHVAVYLGEDCAIHLSRRTGRPMIWPLAQFTAQPEYPVFIGAKRPRPA
ncbi:MAG TPA: NlpC/P60 family protein [Planctomycetaceae bacterium]|nr:NlpC/P60 family protein [Planctomycetaceae bacterium]